MNMPCCPFARRNSFSVDEIIQHNHNWCVGQPDTDTQNMIKPAPIDKKQKKTPAKKRQGRFKNVPYTFGRHFRNWIEQEIGPVKCPIVNRFINKRRTNARYHDSFKDFNELFQNPGMGRQLGQIFFGKKLWINDLLGNERVGDLNIYFQVERSYYEAALNGAKLTEQKVRQI